jgi:hypothetical protein
MNDRTILDLLRARAQGQLTREERDALERELAADPALLALAEDFALVYPLTAVEPAAAGGARTRFEDLEGRLRSTTLSRRVAVAAALLAVTGTAFWLGRVSAPVPAERGAVPLYLTAIELDAVQPADLSADLPAQWADYDPRGERGVRFLANIVEAELLARSVQRPLLVYGSYPGCPMCAALDERVFSDPAVVELSERTVPVRVNLAELSEAEQRSLTARGYPFLEMWRDDGRTTHSLSRAPDPGLFVESLHDGLATSDATGELMPWEELRGAARRFVAARASELEGRLAEAERGFRELARDGRVPAAIAERARGGLARLAGCARELLFEARAAAQSDPGQAARLLEHGIERFTGTGFESDLRAALERLVRDGRFPPLAEADRSA